MIINMSRKTTTFFMLTLIVIELVQRAPSESVPCSTSLTSAICTNVQGEFLTNVRSENITAITFMWSKLTYLSEQDFSKFTNVKYIIIDKCEVPPRVLNYTLSLKQIKVLRVINSNITENYFTALRSSSTLVRLSMNGNKIAVIKKGCFDNLSRLEEIDLSNNQISSIEADAFQGLTALRRLDLSQNMLSEDFDPASLSLPTGCVFQSLVATCLAPTTDGNPSGEHQRSAHDAEATDMQSQNQTEQQDLGQEDQKQEQQQAQRESEELHQMVEELMQKQQRQERQIEQLMEDHEQQRKKEEQWWISKDRVTQRVMDSFEIFLLVLLILFLLLWVHDDFKSRNLRYESYIVSFVIGSSIFCLVTMLFS